MWWVDKSATLNGSLGRCRRRAPTLDGWPAVYRSDWCGDHKLKGAAAARAPKVSEAQRKFNEHMTERLGDLDDEPDVREVDEGGRKQQGRVADPWISDAFAAELEFNDRRKMPLRSFPPSQRLSVLRRCGTGFLDLAADDPSYALDDRNMIRFVLRERGLEPISGDADTPASDVGISA